MRFDVLLFVAICCSLLDRCTARLTHCFREGLDGGAKIATRSQPRGPSQILWNFDGAIPYRPRRRWYAFQAFWLSEVVKE